MVAELPASQNSSSYTSKGTTYARFTNIAKALTEMNKTVTLIESMQPMTRKLQKIKDDFFVFGNFCKNKLDTLSSTAELEE